MKFTDLVLSENNNRNSFLKECLPIEDWQKDFNGYEEIFAILNKAETSQQFIDLILASDTMHGTQIYAELSKDRPDHWKRIEQSIDNWIDTDSDAGGLKIGTDDFSVIVPNGYGDGTMYFAIVGKGCFNHDMLNFWSSISGKNINIYDYDCGGEVIKTLSGRYGVFYGYKFVVFEKWD